MLRVSEYYRVNIYYFLGHLQYTYASGEEIRISEYSRVSSMHTTIITLQRFSVQKDLRQTHTISVAPSSVQGSTGSRCDHVLLSHPSSPHPCLHMYCVYMYIGKGLTHSDWSLPPPPPLSPGHILCDSPGIESGAEGPEVHALGRPL